MWVGGGGGGSWHLIAQKGLICASTDKNKVSDLLEETYTYLVIS